MYGGFRYWFDQLGADARLITESSCRVVGGSGERHEVTARGSKLLKKERAWLEPCNGTEHLPPGQRHYQVPIGLLADAQRDI